jgi:hypothetical protein
VVAADNGNLHRESHVSDKDKAFRLRYLQSMMACGIPLDKTNGILRRFIQEIYGCPLSDATHLKNEYIPKILKMEQDMVTEEMSGKMVSICADATPQMGDVFIVILRDVCINAGSL